GSAGQTLHASLECLPQRIDSNGGALAGTHVLQLRLLEVRDQVSCPWHELYDRHAEGDVRAGMDGELRRHSVDWGGDLRIRQRELRGLQRGFLSAHFGVPELSLRQRRIN